MRNDSSPEAPSTKLIEWAVKGFGVVIIIVLLIMGWRFSGIEILGIRLDPPVSPSEGKTSDLYDTFDNISFDGKVNSSTWAEFGTVSQIQQRDGILIITRDLNSVGGIKAYKQKWLLSQIDYVEAKIMLNSNFQSDNGDIGVQISGWVENAVWFSKCAIHGDNQIPQALIICDTSNGYSAPAIPVNYDTWHILRIDVDSETARIAFYLDGQKIGEYIPEYPDAFKFSEYDLQLNGWAENGGLVSGSFDYVHLKAK